MFFEWSPKVLFIITWNGVHTGVNKDRLCWFCVLDSG